MKHQLSQILDKAVASLVEGISSEQLPKIQIEQPRDKKHGDYSSNIALLLAKKLQMSPREVAEKIIAQIPATDSINKISVEGPGFINFFLNSNTWLQIVSEIHQAQEKYGQSKIGKGQRIHLEFVSTNPNGPLHVGHGRGAAYGASLANLLEAAGFAVHREYYVNDGGRQMDILATSVWLRYLQVCGEVLDFPSNGYKGDYVIDIAKQLLVSHGEGLSRLASEVMDNIPPDESKGGDKDLHIDALIERAKNLLGSSSYRTVFDLALNTMLEDIRSDLEAFGVHFQEWFSERNLMASGAVMQVIEKLRESNHLYEREGATWFNSSAFGDDKDRVVLRENGQPTYFAADAAYRMNILERGYPKLINVLGADHHGYVPRIRAVIKALGFDADVLEVPIIQFAVLYRGKDRVQMSTRSGSFVTLRELREEVGNDAARFFYVLRKCEQHMDFDLELAKSKSNENPVYYVQYAHARICSVFRQLEEKKLEYSEAEALKDLTVLNNPHELAVLQELARYKEVIEIAALTREPHMVAHYLRDLAAVFHTYYNAHTFIVEDVQLRNARLALIAAARIILANGLKILGVSAPTAM